LAIPAARGRVSHTFAKMAASVVANRPSQSSTQKAFAKRGYRQKTGESGYVTSGPSLKDFIGDDFSLVFQFNLPK